MPISFVVDYAQGETGNGEITLTVGNAAPQTVPASGRLDAVGDSVISEHGLSAGVLGDVAEIECTRTSTHSMRVVARFSDSDEFEQDYLVTYLEHVVEDVPLQF